MPRSGFSTVWVERASSQTLRGGRVTSTAGRVLCRDLVLRALGLRGAAALLEQPANRGELLLEPRQPLLERLQLPAEERHRLDRGRAQAAGLVGEDPQLVAFDDLEQH